LTTTGADQRRSLGRRVGLIVRQIGSVRLLVTLIVLIIAVSVARFSWKLPFATDAESILYDFRSAAAAPAREQDQRITLIVYNDDTLIQTGRRSPLDRTILAKALTRLDGMGAKSIGIDILIDQAQPEDPALIDAFRKMKTPTWLAYASHLTNGSKITWEQQQFLERYFAQLKPGN
jgi:adenylate cyclase